MVSMITLYNSALHESDEKSGEGGISYMLPHQVSYQGNHDGCNPQIIEEHGNQIEPVDVIRH